MCLMLDQFLWGHSSRVCDISCSSRVSCTLCECVLISYYLFKKVFIHTFMCVKSVTTFFKNIKLVKQRTSNNLNSYNKTICVGQW